MSNGNLLFRKLKYFDAYPKTLEDFRVKTFSGAIISIICTFIIILLFISEWVAYLSKDVQQELFVDVTRGGKININLNITFPSLPCQLLSIDSMDVSGAQQTYVTKGVIKKYLNKFGEDITDSINKSKSVKKLENKSNLLNITCGSCYGAESPPARNCCNTCEEVKLAYKEKRWHLSLRDVEQCKDDIENIDNADRIDSNEFDKILDSGNGCQLIGHLEVNKVAGSFHVAPGYSYEENHMHVHDIKIAHIGRFNSSHIINHFYFGDSRFPNQINPLESQTNIETDNPSVSFSYFIKVVPTTYEYEDGRVLNNSYQYSVTKSRKIVDVIKDEGKTLPGVFFTYELSPIMVRFIEKRKSLTHFLTSCCAIIGGLFTVAGLFDAFVYKYYNLYKKSQLNKLT